MSDPNYYGQYPQQPQYPPQAQPQQYPQQAPPQQYQQQPQYAPQQPGPPPQQNPYGAAPAANPYGSLPAQSSTPPAQTRPGTNDAPDAAITIGPFVLSHPKLFRPEVFTGKGDTPDPTAKPKFSAELIVYRDHPQYREIYQRLYDAANAVSMSAAKLPIDSPQFRNPAIRENESRGADRKPGIFIMATTYEKPPTVIAGDVPVASMDESAFYAGCLVYATIKPHYYDKKGGKGVKWFLNGIMKVGDGTPLATERDPLGGFQALAGKIQTSFSSPPPQQPHYDPQQPPQYHQQAPPQYQQPYPQQAPPQQYQQPPYQQPYPPQAPPQQYQQPPQQPQYPQHQPPMPGQMPHVPY